MSYVKVPVLRDFEKIKRLFEIVSSNNLGYIAGGFSRWSTSPRKEPSPFRDVDVFTTGDNSYHRLVHTLRYVENLHVKHESDISITFRTDNNEVWKECPMINLIKPLKKNQLLTYGSTLEEVLDNFDFSICRVGFVSETECLADENYLSDETKKKLRVLKMESPVACLNRLCKYAGKGYRVTIPQIMNILKEWNDRGGEYHSKLFKALDKMMKPKYYMSVDYGYGESHTLGYPSQHRDEDYSYQKESAILSQKNPLIEVTPKVKEDLFEEEIESDTLYQLIRIG